MYWVMQYSPAVAFCYDNSSLEYKKLPENKMIIIETSDPQIYEDMVGGVNKKVWADVIRTYKTDPRFFNVIADIKKNALPGRLISDFIRVFAKEGWLLFVPSQYTHTIFRKR